MSWAFLLSGAGTAMNIWAMITEGISPFEHAQMMTADWTAVYAVQMVSMWWAMMLPGVLLAAVLGSSSIRLTVGFVVIHALGWVGFSALATKLRFAFEVQGLLDPTGM